MISHIDCQNTAITPFCNIGGDAFQVDVRRLASKGSSTAVGKVEDLGDGLYRAVYCANIAASYEVLVTCGGAQRPASVTE